MKQPLLIALLMLVACLNADAQKIRFADTTNKWSLVAFSSDPSIGPASARYTRDTVIAGTTYHRLTTNGVVLRDTLAVREDTLNGKIYFRFVTRRYSEVMLTDTVEHLLFNYRLLVGDTLKASYTSGAFSHVVERLDSVQLGAVFYKHWVMRLSSSPGVIGFNYEFIEGVGTNQSPYNVYVSGLIPEKYHLRCFSNKGIKPPCVPAVYIPLTYYTPTKPWEPIPVDSFDNSISCMFKYVGVSSIERNPAPVLSPNPGGKESVLNLPPSISKCSIVITDVTGRVIASKNFSKATNIPIGQYLSTPGVYYYTLQDASTGQRYTGRFIFR